MSRNFIIGILLILSITASSPAVAAVTFSESFNGATLDPQLYVTTSSSAYSLTQLTPGSTWQMSKQAGTTTGAVELHTNFKVSGNFTVDLTLDNTNVGTGDFGMRIGEDFYNYPIAEMFFTASQGTNSGTIADYFSNSGYGAAGFGTTTHTATLRIVRTGNQFKYFADGHLSASAVFNNFSGPTPVTIFLRPSSYSPPFSFDLGQPDAHVGVLDQFTITADAFVFVPEPTTVTLLTMATVFAGFTTRRMRRLR